MKFKLIIDQTREEAVVATVRKRSPFSDQLEALVMQYPGQEGIAAFTEDEMKLLPYSQIECICIQGGRTYAIDIHGKQYRLKQRLHELEAVLPSSFIRINKSAIANENRLERYAASFSGAVDAVFKCGYKEYVSRRCFAEIKRRYKTL